MNDNKKLKISFSNNMNFDIDYVRQICSLYPNSLIIVEVNNTKGITSSMIKSLSNNVVFRIAGGYDNNRVRRFYSDLKHEGNNYYYDSVIYTKNETIKLLEEIEKIESGLNSNWSEIQKLIYIYDRLKSKIMYDPKFNKKNSSEIRSLRGLITKQTVCSGFSLILKEFLDRQDIECEYVEGYTDRERKKTHAWNIVKINDKLYPVDLTFENTRYRYGKYESFMWLAQDLDSFCECHFPSPGEKTQDYRNTLSQIDSRIINNIYSQIGAKRTKEFLLNTYEGKRNDGSRFIIAQIGDQIIDNENYYRYYYSEISEDNKKTRPLILYSETNLNYMIESKKFNKPIPPNYEYIINNILFSKENIANSLSRDTYYIGQVKKRGVGNKIRLVSSTKEISKPRKKQNLFKYPIRIYTRGDGTKFIAQLMNKDDPLNVDGINVYRYDILEIINKNNEKVLKKNTIYTERDFFMDKRVPFINNVYLSRENIRNKTKNFGGYMGYYDPNNIERFNPALISFFETSKNIEINTFDNEFIDYNPLPDKIPTFEELKSLAMNYEIQLDKKTNEYKIRHRYTNKFETDNTLKNKALLANIWLASAGIQYAPQEIRPGIKYAFSLENEDLYYTICQKLIRSVKNNHVIDTVSLFKEIASENANIHNKEIIINLFQEPYQTELINKLFIDAVGIKESSLIPEPLYSSSYASNLAFRHSSIR